MIIVFILFVFAFILSFIGIIFFSRVAGLVLVGLLVLHFGIHGGIRSILLSVIVDLAALTPLLGCIKLIINILVFLRLALALMSFQRFFRGVFRGVRHIDGLLRYLLPSFDVKSFLNEHILVLFRFLESEFWPMPPLFTVHLFKVTDLGSDVVDGLQHEVVRPILVEFFLTFLRIIGNI